MILAALAAALAGPALFTALLAAGCALLAGHQGLVRDELTGDDL